MEGKIILALYFISYLILIKAFNFKRQSGILAHVTSLPSIYGIGVLGSDTKEFIDFLAKSNQKLWQILPLGHTGYGDSPYMCFSAFAGNPLLIDFDQLISLNLIDKSDVPVYPEVNYSEYTVNYEEVVKNKWPILNKACKNFLVGSSPLLEDYKQFKAAESKWLDDYALFLAVKDTFGLVEWQKGDEDIKMRKEEAMARYKAKLQNEIEVYKCSQFFFYKQGNEIKKYANDRNIKVIGDIPIYVAADSSDMWSNTDLFQVFANRTPIAVGGVPPDHYSKTGQFGGNPLYNGTKLRELGYKWGIERISANLKLYDYIRLDHFRGFAAYFSIPFWHKTAEHGHWELGAQKFLFEAINNSLGDVPFIVEDLGYITPDVNELRELFNFPAMRLLEFGLSGEEIDHLPHYLKKHQAYYTSIHDTNTAKGFFNDQPKSAKDFILSYLSTTEDDIAGAMIRATGESIANIAMASMQDLLELGSEARMNYPGTSSGNWRWRFAKRQIRPDIPERLKKLNKLFDR